MKKKKSRLELWAENEVKLASQECDDYGNLCRKSALKAYKSLLKDDHSGCSWNITKNILIRLMNDLPLTSIEDKDFIQEKEKFQYDSKYLADNGLKYDIQCSRKSSCFKEETLDGKVTYRDVDRARFHDANDDSWWQSGDCNRLIDEMFPITMPYMPSDKKYKVYGETFYIDENGNDVSKEHIGEFNLRKIYYVVTPDEEKIEINKEIKD